MGHHYVPQAYLTGFSVPHEPGMIWMYDKNTRAFTKIPIKVAVQEDDYYDIETERELSKTVEGPAHSALARLRRREPLDGDGRSCVALYIAVMIMRVPRRRRLSRELLPAAVDDTIGKVEARIDEWAEDPRTDQNLVAARRAQLASIRENVLRDPPTGVIERIRSPWPSDKILARVHSMTWRILVSERSGHFLTSDNPAYFVAEQGIGREESEITFPLASDLALVADWRGKPESLIVVRARPAQVREVNRRVAYGAERFVFYHERKDWVATLVDKPHPRLTQIPW
jgi:Protein of unknown function (DUF4238)